MKKLFVLGVILFLLGMAAGLSAEDCQEGVCLQPGQEVIIYCNGNQFEMEYIDDLTGVARCDEVEFMPVLGE